LYWSHDTKHLKPITLWDPEPKSRDTITNLAPGAQFRMTFRALMIFHGFCHQFSGHLISFPAIHKRSPQKQVISNTAPVRNANGGK
jgi:hypothetical protein